MIVTGLNPVLEAVRAGRVDRLQVSRDAGARVEEVVRLAAERGIQVEWVDRPTLDRLSGGTSHQGLAAALAEPAPETVEEVVAAASGPPLLLVLDGVEDPQNVGAVIRTADAAGVDAVVRQSRRAAPLGAATARASAGALAHVRMVTVVNIARTLDTLKQLGIWTVGLAADGALPYDRVDLTLPTALVVGAEGSGLRRLVRERCDWIVSIPMRGRVASLNVSVAAGVALFEACRQRRLAESGGKPAK